MGKNSKVAIIGAGPYGISIGLNLKARNVPVQVFGPPMSTWLTTMPKGMDLKSEGYASTIHDPSKRTLETYCAQNGVPYKPVALPVPLDTFSSYGMDCYSRLGDTANSALISSVAPDGQGYRLTLESGQQYQADFVVVAAGITHFAHLPEDFSKWKSERISHSSTHSDLTHLKDKEILIVGAGASAIDLAVLAAEGGAKVTLVCRHDIKWNIKRNDPRPLFERIRLPESCMGPGIRSCLYEKSPLGFRTLPGSLRDKISREFAGPAGGWSIRDRFSDAVPYLPYSRVTHVVEKSDGLEVQIESENGDRQTKRVDQMICATGYKTDLAKLKFLDDSVRGKIAVLNGSPVLSSQFESTCPGVYFVGKAAAVTFGPLMRFVCGTEYAAKRLSRHLAAAAA